MSQNSRHLLTGLEPDNLLAFLALLGLLRALEEARPACLPRVAWTVDTPPVRPMLYLVELLTKNDILNNLRTGLKGLAHRHDFGQHEDLSLTADEARERLGSAATADRYTADLWASLICDATVDVKKGIAEPTPLCLLFGQGGMHFLSRLASVARLAMPPPRKTRGKTRERGTRVSETACLDEALFQTWERLDGTESFRWDPHEDVRYATRARNPTDRQTKEKTQHGANRLATIGLSALTAVPHRDHAGRAQLSCLCSPYTGRGRSFTWPIWRHPISLAAIRALLGHPRLDDSEVRRALGVVERRRALRIREGRYFNVTKAAQLEH